MFMGVKRIFIPTAQIDVLLKEVEELLSKKKVIEFVQHKKSCQLFKVHFSLHHRNAEK